MAKATAGTAEIEIQVLIVSHKRAEYITTHEHIANAKVCIPASQLGMYKEHHPELEYVVHPDSIRGLSLKRQWIYEKFKNMFMLDDDLTGMHAIHQDGHRVDPELAYDLIQWAGNVCHMMGKYLFGFNSWVQPAMYNAFKPIRNNGYINGAAMGLLHGSGLKFPAELVSVDDYYISAMNAHLHRSAFIDGRFNWRQKETFSGKGGLADYRTTETERQDLIRLRQLFGDAIKVKRTTSRAKNKNQYGRSLIIPF